MKVLIKVQLSPHKYKTPEGYLICEDSVLARTGKQQYMKCELYEDCEGDQTIIDVDRKPEQVFSPETLASFENKPLTCEHPNENVTPENYRDYAIGFVRDVHKGKYEGQDVMLGTLVVTDADAIDLIESGDMNELSCGYDCDITTGDNPEQINIRGNHVALCSQGRAGIAKIIDSLDELPLKDVEPKKGESKEDFIARFMEATKEEYPDPKQRVAVAYSYWEKSSVKDALIAGSQYIDINNNVWEITNVSSGKITLTINNIANNIIDANVLNSLIDNDYLKPATTIQDDAQFAIQFKDIVEQELKPEYIYIDGEKIIAQFASENDAMKALNNSLLRNAYYDKIKDENAYYLILTNEEIYSTYTANKLRSIKGKDSAFLKEKDILEKHLINEYGQVILKAMEKYLELPENSELVWKLGHDVVPQETIDEEFHEINENLMSNGKEIIVKAKKVNEDDIYYDKEKFHDFIEWFKNDFKLIKDNDKFIIYEGDNGWYGTKLSSWNKKKLTEEEVVDLTRFGTPEEIIDYLINNMGIVKEDILVKIDKPEPKKAKKDSVKNKIKINDLRRKIEKIILNYIKNYDYTSLDDADTKVIFEQDDDTLTITVSSDTLDYYGGDDKLFDLLDELIKPYDSYFEPYDEINTVAEIDLSNRVALSDEFKYEDLKSEIGKRLFREIKRLNLVENKDFEIQEKENELVILTNGEFNHNLILTILLESFEKSVRVEEIFDENKEVGKIIISYGDSQENSLIKDSAFTPSFYYQAMETLNHKLNELKNTGDANSHSNGLEYRNQKVRYAKLLDKLVKRYKRRFDKAMKPRKDYNTTMDTKVRQWYTQMYPRDIAGKDLNPDVTFRDVFNALDNYQDIYELLGGYADSVVREAVFAELATLMKCDYEYIYSQWVRSNKR